jgi:Ni/Fe-hydrogenase 1 B-type cytochrome subunit
MAHTYATREEHPLVPRLLHWVHLVSMFILILSGLYIAHPFLPGLMGVMRGAHLIFMWVLIITAIWRLVWAFVGRTAPLGSRETVRDYKHFGPQRENKGTMGGTIAYYTFMRKDAPRVYKYNGLQKGTYVFWLFLIIAQAITGFAIWGPVQQWFLPLSYLVGGPIYMRTIHYVIMWLFVITTAIHIYLSTLHRDQFDLMFMGRESAPHAERTVVAERTVYPTAGVETDTTIR